MGRHWHLESKEGTSSWKYGGEAEFSFAGVDQSYSLRATYDGSRTGATANVDVYCNKFASGSCVEAQTDEWFNQITGKSFAALADVKILGQAPPMASAAAVKNPPEFVKPKEDKGVTSKIGKIDSLEGL